MNAYDELYLSIQALERKVSELKRLAEKVRFTNFMLEPNHKLRESYRKELLKELETHKTML